MVNRTIFVVAIISSLINLSISSSLDLWCFLAGISFGIAIIFAIVVYYEK